MRELKFRAWDIEEKILVPVCQIQWDDGVIDISAGGHWHDEMVGRYILEQFTGLKDKNGVEIYEGDVLEFSDKRVWYHNDLVFKSTEVRNAIISDYVNYPMERRVVSLDWDSCAYEWLYPCDDFALYWEVIGNIHENNELL